MQLTKEWLDSNNIHYIISADGFLSVGGSLGLGGTGIATLPDNLTVGGSLDLRGTGIATLPDNLTVGGSLFLDGTGITALPDNLTVGGSLYLRGAVITALPDNLTVGGSLYLGGTGVTTLPDNLAVGGSLGLEGTGITTLPDNLAVGGSLYLRGTGITALPDNLIVGGYLDLEGTGIEQPKSIKRPADGFELKVKASVELKFNAKRFTIADNILAKIISKKNAVSKILVVGKKAPSYLASDGKGNYAHGDTAREAQEELAFKTNKRDVSEYKNMPPSTKKTPQEWAFIYRMITGACTMGTRMFIDRRSLKKQYTLLEIIKETEGQFGAKRFRELVGM